MLGTTSWKLQPDKGILEIFGSKTNPWKENNGFRYFKLIQTDVNSSGNNILLIGGFEIFGTLIEDINCPNGFLRKLGQFGLDALYPKNKNNHNQNNRDEDNNTNTKKELNFDVNSDESVISYSNPSVINCENSDAASEFSTTSSNKNLFGHKKSSKINKIFGSIRFPAGFNSSLKINILPIRTNNSSINGSQISDSENNQKKEERDEYERKKTNENIDNYDNYNNNNNNDENKNENKIVSNNDLNFEFTNFSKGENSYSNKSSNRSSNKSIENTNKKINRKLTIKSTPGKESFFNEKDLSPNISPLSTKNLEIHRKEHSFK